MKVNIDLGESYEDSMSVVPTDVKNKPSRVYPQFHYSGDKSLDLPDEGTMTVRFKVVRETETHSDTGERYECMIEVREIVSVEADKKAPTRSGSESEDALDKLMKKRMSGEKENY